MTDATLSTNNLLTINCRLVGQIMAVTDRGNVQMATGHRAQTGAKFRPLTAPATLGDAIYLDMPVYVSTSASDHRLNPALIEAVSALVQ